MYRFPLACLACPTPGRSRVLARVVSLAVVLALAAGASPASNAAAVELDCRYPQVADPLDGLRDADEPLAFRFTIDRDANTATMRSGEFTADLELRFAERHLTLFQVSGSGGMYITVIVFDAFDDGDRFRSVHSRHAMIGGLGELRASQHYGRCEPVPAGDDDDGR